MPIYDNALSQEDMQKLVDAGAVCGKCGAGLSIAWGGSTGYNGYILRCSRDINHDTTNTHDIEREQKIKQIKEATKLDSKSLMVMDKNTMLERVNMAKFPQDLTPQDKNVLVQVAITYGFDPLMGEVTIYQGKPFVSIDGRYRKAQETNMLDGVESRPANEQERKDWQIPDGDYFFRSEVYVKGASHAFTGWGRVYVAEIVGGKGFKPVEKNPQRMAEKRAEAQALRKAFHIPLPSSEDIGSPDYDVDTTAVEVKEIAEPKKAKPIEQRTAEIDASEIPADEVKQDIIIDMDWLKESLEKLKWVEVGKWMTDKYKVTGKGVRSMVGALTKEQQGEFVKEVESRLELL